MNWEEEYCNEKYDTKEVEAVKTLVGEGKSSDEVNSYEAHVEYEVVEEGMQEGLEKKVNEEMEHKTNIVEANPENEDKLEDLE